MRNESVIFVAMLSENSDLAVGLVLYIRSYHLFQIDIKNGHILGSTPKVEG